MKLLILILLLPSAAIAQSISVNPMSFSGWGTTPSMGHISYENYGVGIHYFHAYSIEAHDHPIQTGYTRSAVGVSYKPYTSKYFDFGVLVTHKSFPTDTSIPINWILQAKIPLGIFDLTYTHISNGFGILHPINPGADFVGISLPLP